jgi:uncharacterized protein (DUF2267 family)
VSHLFDDDFDDSWSHERFIVTVQQKAGISWDEAERAAEATLRTLGERIAAGQARDLAAGLPRELRRPLTEPGGDAQRFDAREFVRRVAEREGVDPETAERHARAVFIALARLVRDDELEDLAAELGRDRAALLGDRSAAEPLPGDELVERAAARAGLDPARGRRAVEAVLETLAERIAGGEVDDLIARLPPALREPLKRGRERGGDTARKMAPDAFLRRVAEREGVDPEDASDHTRAVLLTLREAVGDDEYFDVTVQLPHAWVDELMR